VGVARSLCRRSLLDRKLTIVWLCQPLLRNAPRKLPNSVKTRKIRAISPFKVIQGHRFCYQSNAHIRLLIKTIARQVLRIKSCIYEAARNLYRWRRAVPLQTFITRHSNSKLSIVMALSTTFRQCAPEITEFGKIT